MLVLYKFLCPILLNKIDFPTKLFAFKYQTFPFLILLHMLNNHHKGTSGALYGNFIVVFAMLNEYFLADQSNFWFCSSLSKFYK